jgi:hypothetical protein
MTVAASAARRRVYLSLPGNEAFEQQRHLVGGNLGNVQAIADDRVGRRAAALAEDVATARKPHDVVDGEEVVLVVELGDQ